MHINYSSYYETQTDIRVKGSHFERGNKQTIQFGKYFIRVPILFPPHSQSKSSFRVAFKRYPQTIALMRWRNQHSQWPPTGPLPAFWAPAYTGAFWVGWGSAQFDVTKLQPPSGTLLGSESHGQRRAWEPEFSCNRSGKIQSVE